MKVDVYFDKCTFHYKFSLEEDDKGGRVERLVPVAEKYKFIQLVGDEYQVTVPPVFTEIHPDLHATAIWMVLAPFVSTRMTLPFPVSTVFANKMKKNFGITFTNVDLQIARRKRTSSNRPFLLFSGGMDSAAASLVMPSDTVHLFLDRIPHYGISPNDREILIDLVFPRKAGQILQKQGKDLFIVKDDHETLYRPYPTWHSDMSLLPALYLADSLNLSIKDTGSVLGGIFVLGYYGDDLNVDNFSYGQKVKQTIEISSLDNILGFRRSTCIAGLSEVCTAMIVNKSPFKGKTSSCYYPSDDFACMRCDKCFRKVVLMNYIIKDEKVPSELIDHFLSFPQIAEIFRKNYLDWHHEWFYVFQKIKSDHPFIAEMHRQAVEGPDLSFLEKWYPRSKNLISAAYRNTVEKNINNYVGTMSKKEIKLFENLRLPPLYAPEIKTARSIYQITGIENKFPDQELISFCDKITALLLPVSDSPAVFSGYSTKSVNIQPEGQAIIVTLEKEGSQPHKTSADQLVLEVECINNREIKYFHRAGNLAISYRKETPVDSNDRMSAMNSFIKLLTRFFHEQSE
jgi:hypothetical protein